MLRLPLSGLKAQSKTVRCSPQRRGALDGVLARRCARGFRVSHLAVAQRGSASGTVWLTIFSMPPPTSFLYLTSAMSGSMPVVSQSIMKPMVPVGASTVTCPLR